MEEVAQRVGHREHAWVDAFGDPHRNHRRAEHFTGPRPHCVTVRAVGRDLDPVAGLKAAFRGSFRVDPHRVVLHDLGQEFL